MKKIGIILLLLVSLFITGCRGSYDKYDETGFVSGKTSVSGIVTNIDVFWHTGDIKIIYGDVTEITIAEESYYVISPQEELRSRYENNTLIVRFCASNLILPAAQFEKDLTITIPNDYSKIDSINIVNITGDINLEVNPESINIETITSDVNIINNYHECSYNIKNVTGNININSGLINKVTVELVSGNIEVISPKIEGGVFLTNVTGNILVNVETLLGGGKVETVTGNIDVNTSHFTDAVLSFKIVTGRWITATQNMSTTGGEIRLGNCTYSLHLEVTTGNIKFIDEALIN